MAAFVGEVDTFEWNRWAQKAGICTAEDEVRRIIVDIGIDDVARVYVHKYLLREYEGLEFPSIENVRQLRQSCAHKSAAVAWMCFGSAMILNAIIVMWG